MSSTSTKRLVIVGAGGFGRETLDACLAAGIAVTGFLDDRSDKDVRGLPVTTVDDWVGDGSAIVAVADPTAREKLVERLGGSGGSWATVVDPRAVVGPETMVGEGCVILALGFVSSSVTIADHVHINYGATIGHDTRIGPFCTVLPGANIAGNVEIGLGATIGSGSVIPQGLNVGEREIVGAGAVVTRDGAAGSTVVGAPARPMAR